ncbi:MAG: aldose epimerase family protein [Polyangiaceae bacterium]
MSSALEPVPFGRVDGQDVSLYTLRNRNGLIARISDHGATLTELHVPDKSGKLADVVLGFDRLEGYRDHRLFFGATVGRVANRIADGRFALEGREYAVATNDPPHHLHGGVRGWDRVVWRASMSTSDESSLELRYVSPDAEEGYPGSVEARVRYSLKSDDSLWVEMHAKSDRPTLVNMAHHSYYNLAGHDSGNVLEHTLTLYSDAYTPGAPVPTGRVEPVEGSPFDFTEPKPVGRDLERAGAHPVGFDHNWILRGTPGTLRPAARLSDPVSGRSLLIESDQPGLQFYSGNFLDGSAVGKGGVRYGRHAGLCLETQAFPNAINVPEWREQVLTTPQKPYRHLLVHRFF